MLGFQSWCHLRVTGPHQRVEAMSGTLTQESTARLESALPFGTLGWSLNVQERKCLVFIVCYEYFVYILYL